MRVWDPGAFAKGCSGAGAWFALLAMMLSCWLHQARTFSVYWGGLQQKCEAAGMRISTSKSEAMVLDRKRVACPLRVGGEVLPQVEEFKYLGVLFTRRCSRHVPPGGGPGEETQDTLAGLGTPRGPPLEELEEVSGVREVWASLLRLLPSATRSQDQADEDGWNDGL
ncbi:hypothetical protein L3Q82_011416 [Scortum barcoo]|uniref:Uncharacterized protein n=1 Tax=Scortum barcoo TaxID=214431 RepID=A0ACB8WA59_9TELE|nr:hypothetical protein L3Q82_011416 [Scortum barcoo]